MLSITDKIRVTSYQPKLFPGSSHSWALKSLSEIPHDAKILDIGVGSGVIGKELSGRSFFNLYGVDPSETVREATSDIYKAIYKTIDEVPTENYDVALLLDVIEHTATPEEFLRQVLAKFSPRTVLISIPNITHWYIRASILLGRFEYSDRGILDRTHLQFFSKTRVDSMISLLKTHGFSQVTLTASVVPLEFVLPSAISNMLMTIGFSNIRQQAASLWPSLFGYQYLIEAKRLG